MRLEEYWGIGPKTSALFSSELGVDRAVAAIESADTRELTKAGLSRGRATRILRRATGAEAMDLLATRDTRDVYKALLDLAEEHAVTEHAADRIRVLTPLPDRAAMEERLSSVLDARDAWASTDEATRDDVLAAFERLHDAGYGPSIISNGNPAMLESLVETTGIGPYVAEVVSADEIRTLKPRRALYEHAADRIDVPLDRLAHVTAHWMDVRGATRAGAAGVWLNRDDDRWPSFGEAASAEVTALDEVCTALDA